MKSARLSNQESTASSISKIEALVSLMADSLHPTSFKKLQMPNSPPHSFLLVVPSRSKAQVKIFAGLPPANKYCATWADMDKYWSPTTAISYSSGEMLMRNL